MSKIHPTALVSHGADLHPSVEVGPYSIIEDNTHLGEGCRIESNVKIYAGTTLGKNNRACHGAMLGCEPQDLTFTPEMSKPLTIGDNNHFKEGTHISRGIKTDSGTIIGDNNYFMGNFHAGHDCIVGNNNILGHGSGLSGHVTVGNHTFIAPMAAVHQFTFIGDRAMIAGCSKIVKDIPPFTLADGNPARISGINSIGLRRADFTVAERKEIKLAYHTIYQANMNVSQALHSLRQTELTPKVLLIVEFFERSDRGVTAHR